jgi:anhydro-N-acetylmuramic acid kinase
VQVVGLMSGTSVDAIDAVSVDLDFVDETTISGRVRSHLAAPMPPDILALLDATLPPAAATAAAICALHTRLGQAFAAAAGSAIDAWGGDLIVCSGQTVYHWVDGATCLGTLQLGAPAWIAERTGVPVLSDLRTRDIACGGQGAPLVALVDTMLFGKRAGVAALNIGGIANLTVPGRALAFDTGPGNTLIDAAVSAATGGAQRMDRDGALAAAGRVRPDLLAALLSEPYYVRAAPKSTGRELFHTGYLRDRTAEVPLPDLVATLTRLTATTIADAARRYAVTELVVSGGGTRNPVLMADLAALLPGVAIGPIDAYGIPEAAKEAYAFAVLGFLSWHGLPATDPAHTGARHRPISGSLTPGRGPLTLPEPRQSLPTRLLAGDVRG